MFARDLRSHPTPVASTESATHERGGPPWFYVELFHLAVARARRCRRALFLGCGGGVALRQFARACPGVAIDVVEPDPRVVALARAHFELDTIPRVTVHVAGGADFVARAPAQRWDAVIVDAYDDTELPCGLGTRAFFAGVRACLSAGGAVAMNVIGALGVPGPVRDVERAARAELDDVRLVPVLDPGEAFSPCALRNVIVLGSRG
jgi:spermidine synthase